MMRWREVDSHGDLLYAGIVHRSASIQVAGWLGRRQDGNRCILWGLFARAYLQI